MTYDWEKDAKKYIGTMQILLPKNLQIVGLAVENTSTGEGALIEARALDVDPGDVPAADVRKDILGDAQSQYDAVFTAVFKKGGDA